MSITQPSPVTPQEWPQQSGHHPFDGEPSWADDIPCSSRAALGGLLTSAERSFSSLRSSSERTRDDSAPAVTARAEGAAEMAALAYDVDPDPERFLSMRAMNERKRLESSAAATALRNGAA